MSQLNSKLYFRVALLALILPLASGDCVYLDLGMESGSIPDSNITASSVKNANTPAKNSRLNFASGSSWCAATSDNNPYLQIDLQTLHIICAVSTQGNSQANQWVKNYTLQSSRNGSSWIDYTEIGQVKSLKGNEDRNSEVKHILYEGVFARYLRFLPANHHGAVCIRTEVFGVKLKPENLALGRTTNQSSTYSSSNVGVAESGRAVDGNPDTDMQNRHCSHTEEDNPSWWRVDLGSDHVPVSEIHIVNRFTSDQERNKDFKITLGNSMTVTNNPQCVGFYTFIQFKASAVCFTDPLKTGRYVGIMTTKRQILQLCEVEVYSRENLAYGKQTAQITTNSNANGESNRAVDGNSETNYYKGSCTHTFTATKPWWRVDLGQVEPVSEVYIVNRGDGWAERLDNFEIRVGSTNTSGGVTNPQCGGNYGVPGGKGLSFFCRPPLYGRYVTIRSLLNDFLTICEVEVYSEKRACPIQALGVASSDAFPDNSFSTSSSSSGNEASKGRLNGVGAWSPSTDNNASDYIQINLKYEFFICAVATQGKSTADHWTTKYKLLLSLNNVDWVTYQENSADKVFNGNSGRNDIVKHNLKEIARARYIRFQPTTFSTHKALRVEVFGILKPAAPSQAPSSFTMSSLSSTSVKASWQLPPVGSRHGIITGFKLLYRRKSSGDDSLTILTIESNSTLTRDVTGLHKYTEYEFQVLAYSFVGNGPKSSVEPVRTDEDAPSAPSTLSHIDVAPSKSHGPRLKMTWSGPAEANGIIRNYTMFYSHEGDTQKETFGSDVLSHIVDVLGGVTYQFHVRAVTIKPGPNVTYTVNTTEYEPSVGPDNVSLSKVNETTFNISWAPLTREKSYGKVIMYGVKEELVSRGKRRKRTTINSRTVNTTTTFFVLNGLPACSRYNVYVRAYTKAGPGPYSQPLPLETSKPDAPWGLTATNSETTQVTLEWKEPNITTEEGLTYTVEYSGTKSYDKGFKDEDVKEAGKSTTQEVVNLVPGSKYKFEVYGTSACGRSKSSYLNVETKVETPTAPDVLDLTEVTVSESVAGIYLWPAEQRNGPISAYQVIVLKIAAGVEELPDDFDSKLKDSNKDNLNFYIATEIKNDPVREKSWNFTVGDDETYEDYVNKGLERGEDYIVFQRAVTHDNNRILEGEVSKVATISVTQDVGGKDKTEGSESVNPVVIAVPVILLLLIIPALLIAVVLYRRRKQSERESDSRRTSVQLDDIARGSVDTTTSTANLVYQNVADIRQPQKDVVKVPPPEEKELVVYSEAEDGKPKPIPVVEFASYFKNKSSNGAIVLREEFKNLPGGMQFPWEVGKDNKVKNRYGNITTYDHSRVVLEKIEGDPKSDFINASYIPTFDEESMCYIATQGPKEVTFNDFWRMIWQENCVTIVMLTNLVEQGKNKCDQYWPDTTSKYGSITVTLHKTEAFADYQIRTFILVKGSEKREVLQFHYTTWPDKGVPQRSTALLGFRWKVYTRHQATGGPLVVHCSAGVGRTGTYIGIDAMLESAKKIKTVFIQNYVQVMRRGRPYMVQKEEQYVFLHQAVMEALTCGNTEIAAKDLRIAINKLATTQKSTKRTGFAEEFKRLQLVSDCQSSGEESQAAFKPFNINKNRFPNIVPLDTARVFLSCSEPHEDYINASFVDDYRQHGAYILTQAPMDNTVEDYWRMISQYGIGTVVMLNSLKEGKQSYPQYWPTEGSVKYGDISLQILSENTSHSITTRKFSILNAQPPKKQSTVQHLQFTGWANRDSCPDPQEILDLLTAIQRSQQQTGNGIIIFQCSDGVGRSGCVATIMSVIERVKIEQTVDVFQTVKLIRARRTGAVDTPDRYEFCYKTIQAYLDSFSTYANFADC
ncbi:receptor-type tyrosine-protein phosphatase S-like isoform X3 [Oculina patagonica]